MKIIIVGGSVAGLTAALVLGEAGHQVEVLERSPRPLVGRGAGIVAHRSTLKYLCETVGRSPDSLTLTARSLKYMDEDGSIASEAPVSYRLLSYATLYSELLSQLASTNSYHSASEVVEFTDNGDQVVVRTRSADVWEGDLLIFADGVHSMGRRTLLPSVSGRYAGYVAWRGTVDPDVMTSSDRGLINDGITYRILPNSHLLTYPIPHNGGRTMLNWLWYRNSSEAHLRDLLLDTHGKQLELSVPQGAVRDTHIQQLYSDAESCLPPPLSRLVRACPDPFVQAIVDIEVPRMAMGRVCLIGDAAFVVRPHVATGSAKAAEDAWQLANHLRNADAREAPEFLAQWEQHQLALGRSLLARARHFGYRAQFENSWNVGMELPFGLYQIGDSNFADTA